MRVIALKTLRKFWAEHPAAKEPLTRWNYAVRLETWNTFADIRQTFPSVDQVGCCYVFNIGGNKFRLIAKVRFPMVGKSGRMTEGRVYVRAILTHAEYDKDKWKPDCGA